MFRSLLYLIIGLFLLSFVRIVIGILSKGLGQLFEAQHIQPQPRANPSPTPAGGDLKRDPVCGTYVPAASSPSTVVGGKTVYFCSKECLSKYRAQA